jgi:hypothetical protein
MKASVRLGFSSIVFLALVSCSKPNDVTEKNIVTAINRWLDEDGICEPFGRMKDQQIAEFRNALAPETLSQIDAALAQGAIPVQGMADRAWTSDESKRRENSIFQGLAESGFLSGGTMYTYQTGGWFAANYAVALMLPTLQPHIQKKEGQGTATNAFQLCYAHAKLDALKRWSKPTETNPGSLAIFTVAVSLDQPFAKSPAFQEALQLSKEAAAVNNKEIEVKLIVMNDGLMVKEDETRILN